MLDLSLCQIASKVNQGEISVTEITEFFCKQTEKKKDVFNSHLHFEKEAVSREIDRVESLIKTRGPLPLAGVPVSIKDNICTKNMPTTCGSKILRDFQSSFDATAVARLKAAGALVFTKVNLDEFGMGSSGENSSYGATKNPWDKDCVPGGSSSGSAVSVAAGMSPVSLGSDTGGSVRQPASFCGIVGMKPSYGRVSRFGLVAYASSLDQIGPFGRRCEDVASVLDIISGHDPLDSTSSALPPTQCLKALKRDFSEEVKSIAVLRTSADDGLQPEIAQCLENVIDKLKGYGKEVNEVSLESISHALASYYIIATAEASSNLSRFDGIRFGCREEVKGSSLEDIYCKTRSELFGKEVQQRIMLGTFALSSGYYDAYYHRAEAVRALLADELESLLAKHDAIVCPTAPTTAYRLGEKCQDPLTMYLGDVYTVPANLAGLPAASVPVGFDHKGLPIGIQIVSAKDRDETVLSLAQFIEKNFHFFDRWPPT